MVDKGVDRATFGVRLVWALWGASHSFFWWGGVVYVVWLVLYLVRHYWVCFQTLTAPTRDTMTAKKVCSSSVSLKTSPPNKRGGGEGGAVIRLALSLVFTTTTTTTKDLFGGGRSRW